MVPSDPDNLASTLRPASDEALQLYLRAPPKIEWKIVRLTDQDGNLIQPLDSSSVGPKHWVYMANAIQRAYHDFDGFVILHGTDTMAYAASALSFLLQNLDKPVVFTGSQLPIYVPRTDAVMNLVNSLCVAGYKATGLPKISEVVICFGDSVFRGNRTTKASTSAWQGFASPNFLPLGKIGEKIVIDKALLRPAPSDVDQQPFFSHTVMEESVAMVALYPGMPAHVLEQVLALDVKGFVLRTFGAGNAPDDPAFLSVLKRAAESGKVIVNTTQCWQGSVEMGMYEASTGLLEAGLITGLDLTPEAALTKLMWLLTLDDSCETSKQMQRDLCGEQSASVFELEFGKFEFDPVHIWRHSATSNGELHIRALQRAILRFDGVTCTHPQHHEPWHADIFINRPPGASDISRESPYFAGRLTLVGPKDRPISLAQDVTSAIMRVHEGSRTISLTIVPEAEAKLHADKVFLDLIYDTNVRS